MGSKIVSALIFVLVLGAVLFVFRSGIFSTLSFPSGRFPSLLNTTSSKATYGWQPDRSSTVISPNKWTPDKAQPSYVASGTWNSQEIPKGFTASQLSPYFHKIRIGSVSPGSEFFYGQISLFPSLSGDDSLDVTGWFLKANRGNQFVPKAINVYDPSGLTPEGEVFLKSGDTLNIYSTQSAIGKNLRINKCIGYLENYNHFTPQLPLSCPYVDRSEISGFSGECQDYITSLGSCRLPAPNPKIPQTDYACRSFLETMNYRGCFDKHVNDADFLSHEWRAWTGSRFLDSRHDDILLFDHQGLLVDKYSY